MKVFWNENYTSIKHDFDTSRKSQNIVCLINKTAGETSGKIRVLPNFDLPRDMSAIEIVDPEKTSDISKTEELINEWLTPTYVGALKTNHIPQLSQSQGFEWCPELYRFARAHTHGLIASVDEVLAREGRSGSLSSGLHHASKSSGLGFCTINGIALSAIYANEQGLEPIVLDFDAHCSGGTMDFLKTFNGVLQTKNTVYELGGLMSKLSPPIRHIDLSTSYFDEYDIDVNESWANLHVLNRGEDYLEEVQRSLELAKPFITDKTIFIYNAGIDPLGSQGIDEEVITQREKIVSEFIDDHKAIFALAGGYSGMSTTRDDVAKIHLKTIYGWAWQTN